MNEKDLLRLEFDLYSRHHIITQAVRALAGEKPLQLLDAGGRSGLIQTFMPEQDLTVVDIREPETDSDKKLKEQNKYFLGSVLQMPLPDRSVDLALSLEMLEHMTAEERPRALAEMLRVSRMGIIFSFPQDSAENDQAERLVNAYYKRVAGEEHPWLKEHIQNRPLPQPGKLEAALRDLGLEFVRLSSSNTYLWTLMRYYIFSTHGFHTNTEALFEFYNTHITGIADAVGPSYRSIYVAVRPEFAQLLRRLPKQTSGKTSMPREVLTLLDKVFDSVTTQLEKKTQHIVNLEASTQAKDELIVNLGKQIKDKDTHIHNLVEHAGAKDLRIVDLEQHTRAKDTHIRNIESAQHLQESLLASLQELIQAKETHIQNLESAQTAQDVHLEDLQAHVKQQQAHITSQEKVISELKDEVSKSMSSLRQELEQAKQQAQRLAEDKQEHIEGLLGQLKQQAQQFTQDKHEQIEGLVGQLKQQAKVVQQLDQTLQAKDIHIRNIQPTFDEMQSFRSYAVMRWLFAGAHQAGAWALHTRQRARHLLLAGHIWRTQGAAEVMKSLKRYITGTSIVQSPLQANVMPLNEQYKLLRELQLLSKLQLKEQIEEVASWRSKPLVSIIVGAYFVDPRWLEKCLEAIHQQTYSKFEVMVTLHPDLEEKSVVVLKKWAKKDQRIRLVTPEQLHGATSLWNAGLQAATGEYVLLVAGDDELPVQALYHLMKPLQANQQFDLIYGDEDTVQTDGTLINPHFKSDFNPDLLLSMNYFGHPVAFRRSLAESVGWLREDVDGAQEYDLWLRLVEKTQHIAHVSQILYHQRVSTNSLADAFEKRAAFDFAAMQALEGYAERNKIQGTVSTGLAQNTFRFQRKIMHRGLVSIIIPFKDKAELLKLCVPSILNKTDYPNYEILLISNNSTKRETAQAVAELVALDQRVRSLEYNVLFNYSQINNWAVTQAKGEYILMLNNDIEVISSEWLSAMLEHIQRPEVGAVGAQLLYPNNTIQHAGVILGIGGAAGHNHKYFPADLGGYFSRLCTVQNFSAVTGACLLTKKQLFEQVNGLNAKHLGISLNDVDYCLKLRRAGYLVTYTPYAKLYHHESVSRGFEDGPEKQQRFAREFAYFEHAWGKLLIHDPYYNPNLTLKAENFSLNVY